MNILKILVTTAVACFAATAAHAQEKITLRFAHQFPPLHYAVKLSVEPFIKLIEERSKGRVKIEQFPAEQLAKAAGMLDAVKNRVTDIGFVGMTYVTAKTPLTSVSELPGLYSDSVEASRALDALIKGELLEQEYLRNGVRPLFAIVTPPYQLILAKKGPINDISDIQGMKLRAAGSTAELIAQSIGAIPVRVSSSDTYLAVERGTIDGMIYSSAGSIGFKLENLLASATTNASLSSLAFALMINESVWKGLPQEVRDLITQVSNEVGPATAVEFKKEYGRADQKLRAAGVKVYELSPKVQAQFNDRLAAVQADWVKQVSARGLPAKETLAAFKAHLQAK